MYSRRSNYNLALAVIDEAIAEMKTYLSLLTKQRQDDAVNQLDVPIASYSLQFLQRTGDMKVPFLLTSDEMTSPLMLLTHFQSARIEMRVMSETVNEAALIQAGGIILTPDDESTATVLASDVKDMIQISRDVMSADKFFEEPEGGSGAGGSAGDDGAAASAAGGAPVAQTQKTTSSSPPHRKKKAAGEAPPVAAPVISSHSPEDAELLEPSPPGLNFDVSAAMDILDNYLAVLQVGKGGGEMDLRAVSADAASVLKSRFGVDEENGKLSVHKEKETAGADQYLPPLHDPSSVRAEIMPLVNVHGRDDVNAWLQWAVAETQGFGLGFMGQASPPTTSLGVNTYSKDGMDKVELENIRQNLVRVDKKLAKRFDEERKFRAGDRERILLLNATLAKISSQLNLRKDAGLYVKRMEELLVGIQSTCDKYSALTTPGTAVSTTSAAPAAGAKGVLKIANNDPHYAALVKRFRLDFEEWDNVEDAVSAPKKKLARLLLSLQTAKEYLALADASHNIHLKRDALRRISNIYLEIVRAPTAAGHGAAGRPAPVPGTARSTETATVVSEAESVMPEEGTLPELLELPEDEIEAKEKEDYKFVKKFGKVRACQFVARLRKLTQPVL